MRHLWIVLPAAIVLFGILHPARPLWSPDGVLYARMMLADAGRPPDLALSIPTGSRYLQSPAHRIGQERLFANRPLYPWLGSLLYPYRGFQALIDISRISFVVATGIVFVLIARFAGTMAASLCAAAFAGFPAIRSIASAALTDMLALALWSAVLLAIVVAVQRRAAGWIVVFGLLTIVLALNRPTMYYPLLAAIAVAVAYRNAVAYRLAIVAIVIAIAYVAVARIAGFAGFAEELQWVHRHAIELNPATNPSLRAWWFDAARHVAIGEVKLAIRSVYPAAIFLAAVAGLWLRRDSLAIALFAGAIAATLVSIAANPVQSAFDRTVELPLSPLLLIGIGLLIQLAVRRYSVSTGRFEGA